MTYGRFYLMGDENCGVSLYCRDCDDGGRPIVRYAEYTADSANDSSPEQVYTVDALLDVANRHENQHAGRGETLSQTSLHVLGS